MGNLRKPRRIVMLGLLFLFCFLSAVVVLGQKNKFPVSETSSIDVNQKTIIKAHFEKELKSIIDEKETTGFKREELVINLKVEERTRRGDIADIQVALRRMNVRRIIYSTFDKQAALNRITKDPIVRACNAVVQYQTIIIRNIAAQDAGLLTVGVIFLKSLNPSQHKRYSEGVFIL